MGWIEQVDDYLDTIPVGGTFCVSEFYQWLPAGDDENASFRLQVHRGRQPYTRNVCFCEERGRYAYWRKVDHTEYQRVKQTVSAQAAQDLVRAYKCEALAAARSDPATYTAAVVEVRAAVTMFNAALAFMGAAPVPVP